MTLIGTLPHDIGMLLLDQSPDAVVYADREGIIRWWNAAAERVFGHPSSEAIGQSLDLIVPERFRTAHWTGFHRALENGTTQYAGRALPTRSQRKDGQTIYIEMTFAILQDAHDTVIGALAHIRDITQRFTEEREMRARLVDLERRLEELGGTSDPRGGAATTQA